MASTEYPNKGQPQNPGQPLEQNKTGFGQGRQDAQRQQGQSQREDAQNQYGQEQREDVQRQQNQEQDRRQQGGGYGSGSNEGLPGAGTGNRPGVGGSDIGGGSQGGQQR